MADSKTTGEPFSRITQSVASSGQVVVTADSPAEIASWYFPHDDDEEMRERLKLDIEGIIERRLADLNIVELRQMLRCVHMQDARDVPGMTRLQDRVAKLLGDGLS